MTAIPDRRLFFFVVASVVLINFATMPAIEYRGDAQAVRAETLSILKENRWSVPGPVAQPFGPRGAYFYQRSDGAWFPKFGVLNTLVYLPALLMERLVTGRVDYHSSHVLSLNLFNLICAGAAAFYLVCLASRYTRSRTAILIFVFASLYGTFWWNYLRAQTFESYLVPLVLAFFYHFVRGWDDAPRLRDFSAAGIVLGALCLIKTVFVIFVPVSAALFILSVSGRIRSLPKLPKRHALIAFWTPVTLSLVLLALTNWYRFDAPLNSGYTQWEQEKHLFGGSILTGIRGYLVEPRTALLAHYPLLLFALPFWARFLKLNRVDAICALSLGAVFICLHAARANWSGATSYGPRYCLAVAPLLSVPFLYFVEWILFSRPAPLPVIAAACASLVIAISFVMQVAVNSLPFYFSNETAVLLEDSGAHRALKYFRRHQEGRVDVDFLLYARGHVSGFVSNVVDVLPPEAFARLEGWKADTRWNYYWFHRPVERLKPLHT